MALMAGAAKNDKNGKKSVRIHSYHAQVWSEISKTVFEIILALKFEQFMLFLPFLAAPAINAINC